MTCPQCGSLRAELRDRDLSSKGEEILSCPDCRSTFEKVAGGLFSSLLSLALSPGEAEWVKIQVNPLSVFHF
jgi:hypothetical protein